ncbi:MAG: S-methyl-5'-thioadenosine phosphorylase [Spirochaetota bacterium]
MEKIKYAVIGGSGLLSLENLSIEKEIEISTPYGMMSDKVTIGFFRGTKHRIAFLPRHGRNHTIMPSNIPQKANVWGLKSLGVERVFAVSAVGSLKENIKPGDLVIPSQIFDRTKNRDSTFFEDGLVGHIPFGEPFCPTLSKILYETVKSLGYPVHKDETYVCMEGPAFSTKAESEFYRMLKAGVIGMTALPEAKLFREAEICYTLLSTVTDYDCWKEGEEAVNVKMVLETMKKCNEMVHKVLVKLFETLPEKLEVDCQCQYSLMYAITTKKEGISKDMLRKLDLLLGKYFSISQKEEE